MALLLSIVLATALAAAAAASALTARAETMIAGNHERGIEAAYIAEGALTRAVRRLSETPDWSQALREAPPPGDAATATLTADLARRGLGGAAWGADTPVWRLHVRESAEAWLAPGRIETRFTAVVWIADDPADNDGEPLADANGRLLVHSLALGPRGARRSVRALVERGRDASGEPLSSGARVVSVQETRW